MVRIFEIAQITPGRWASTCSVIKAVVPDVPLTTVFRGIFPFLIADIIHLCLLFAFPMLSLWLPQHDGMKGEKEWYGFDHIGYVHVHSGPL